MTRLTGIVIVWAVTPGCGHWTRMDLTPQGAQVRVSDGNALEGCEYVGDFAGGWGARGVPSPWASNQVRNLAAEKGATDLVWAAPSGGNVVGRGYRCR